MRLAKNNNLFILLIVVFVGGMQIAATDIGELDNFTPGTYRLVKGNSDSCVGSEIRQDNEYGDLVIGPHHIFRTNYELQSFSADGCNYRVENTVDEGPKKTTLKYSETVACEGDLTMGYEKLEKTVSIRKKRIILNVRTDSDPTRSYRCVWKLVQGDY